jgi:hypothetical protein
MSSFNKITTDQPRNRVGVGGGPLTPFYNQVSGQLFKDDVNCVSSTLGGHLLHFIRLPCLHRPNIEFLIPDYYTRSLIECNAKKYQYGWLYRQSMNSIKHQ